ncbi:unnamed protein product [Camellia sinensis]
MIRSNDGGPPRWFSPLECRSRSNDSPLLLFLPGIDGVGLGLVLHHQRLGQIFDMRCLHIPIMDRTPFAELVKQVERTVRSENYRSPNRPIYLVGESLGGCLALAVAARNPDIDLILILANPATCFGKSQLQHLIPFLEIMPEQLHLSVPYVMSSFSEYSFEDGDGYSGERASSATNSWRDITGCYSFVIIPFCKIQHLHVNGKREC